MIATHFAASGNPHNPTKRQKLSAEKSRKRRRTTLIVCGSVCCFFGRKLRWKFLEIGTVPAQKCVPSAVQTWVHSVAVENWTPVSGFQVQIGPLPQQQQQSDAVQEEKVQCAISGGKWFGLGRVGLGFRWLEGDGPECSSSSVFGGRWKPRVFVTSDVAWAVSERQ